MTSFRTQRKHEPGIRLKRPSLSPPQPLIFKESQANMSSAKTQRGLERRMRIEALAAASNDLLSDEDQAVIRDLIEKAQDELVRLDTVIWGASGTAINALMQRRIERIEKIARLRVGIAVHKRLPPELVATIFVHCQQGYVVTLRSRNPSSLPWALCQVCSRWREIALAEPLLWALIRLPPRFSHSKVTIEFIHHVLSHHGGAGKVALDVGLSHDKDWTTLLNLVSTYSSRVSGLQIKIIDSASPNLDSAVGAFDVLETLTITNDYWPRGNREADETPIAAFALARNLRKLRIHSTGHRTWFSSTWRQRLLFPWATLTELVITTISPKTSLNVLAQCPQIHRLAVTFRPDETPHRGVFKPVSLPQLHSLNVTPNEVTNLTEFLDALVLSTLKKLTLGRGILEPWPQETVLKLLSRSGHTMESIETSDFIVPGDCILPLMRALPHLTELSVCTEGPIPECDFLIMESENIAPKLRVFRGWGVSSYRPALDFLNTRWSRDDQGRYDGIRDAKFRIPRISVAPDSANFHRSLSQMKKGGRVIVAECF